MARRQLSEAGGTGLRSRSAQQRTALVSIIAAAGLVALKLVIGLLSGSLGLLAEAAHSGTDLIAAVLTFYALGVAVRPPDGEHPFGHGKAEHLAALGEGAFLVLVSGAVAYESLGRILGGHTARIETAWWVFATLGIVLAVDVTRASISWRAARRHGSAALAANAVHFASDFAGTLAVLVGLLLVRAGEPKADAFAALFVAMLVVSAAVRLMRGNVDVLMDRAPAGAAERVRAAIEQVEPRAELRRVRVREAGGRAFVDAVVAVAPDAALAQGHAVADSVEQAAQAVLPGSDVTVHVEQAESGDLRERVTGAALSVRRVREVHNVRMVDVDGRTELSLHVKLPPALALGEAHGVADEVERAIRAVAPEVAGVYVHLEPLAGVQTGTAPAPAEDDAHRDALAEIVRARTGRAPREVRLHREARGLVAYLTVELPAQATLAEAHAVAARIEDQARIADPGIAEVVVHTEPDAISER
ncbi:MAG: cation-efflux pump [Solirubrobacteraceae bacterium]|nr:cation-efflux pump [Solirubrobacteraceae bacterium]